MRLSHAIAEPTIGYEGITEYDYRANVEIR